MIVFDLKCQHGHKFEAWFQSSSAYSEQLAAGHVTCPYCESTQISKALMAPNVAAKGNQSTNKSDLVPVEALSEAGSSTVSGAAAPAPAPATATSCGPAAAEAILSGAGDPKLAELAAEAQQVFAKLKTHVEENCDYVGGNFADEARKIHYGESTEHTGRGIYGESTKEEAVELMEEGIDIMPLPGTPIRRSDA